MKNLITRLLTGIVYTGVIIGSVLLGKYTFCVVFLVAMLLTLKELYSITEKSGATPQKTFGYISATVLFLIFFLQQSGLVGEWVIAIFVPCILFIFISELYSKKKNSIMNMASTLFGVVYVALPFSLLNHLVFPVEVTGDTGYMPHLLLGMFIIIWSYDSGAYIFGVTFGKHRLFERISPKKSWEGAIGGGVFAIIIAAVTSHYFDFLSLTDAVFMGALTVLMATFGDLSESLLKRSVGVKDSGNALPGHGGFLDRFDSLLFVSPIIYVYIKIFIF